MHGSHSLRLPQLWPVGVVRFPGDAEPLLKAEAERRGIDPARVVFSDKEDARVHLRRADLCDVMLDTPHYNGGTTTTDGLWAGVPVVSLPMRSMGSRYAPFNERDCVWQDGLWSAR